MAQVVKAAVKDARVNESTPKSSDVSLDAVLANRKKSLRKSDPVICYTHKIQFNNRRDFRLHVKYQHSTDRI